MSEILRDSTFMAGFNVLERSLLENNHDELLPLAFNKLNPEWRLAEYFSKYDLFHHCNIERENTSYRFYNEGKEVKRDEDGSLTLNILAGKEYDHPRIEGEPWPHLLIEQEFQGHHLFRMKKLTVKMSLDFLELESYMNRIRNELHTLQVSLYFALGSRNEKSKGCNDFYWFGLPFIDAPRYHFPKPWVNQDIGKEDATNKLIYALDPHLYMKDELQVGNHLDLNMDVLPYMLEAYKKAKEMNYLRDVDFEDVEILSLNLGFEATGAFDGKIKIGGFSIVEER